MELPLQVILVISHSRCTYPCCLGVPFNITPHKNYLTPTYLLSQKALNLDKLKILLFGKRINYLPLLQLPEQEVYIKIRLHKMQSNLDLQSSQLGYLLQSLTLYQMTKL